MNNKLLTIQRDLLLFLSFISLIVLSNFVQANDEKIPVELLELMAVFPIQSGEVDIDVTMDKDSYTSEDTPKLSIAGYNKTNKAAKLDVYVGFIGPDGTVYEYPDWNTSSIPWLASYSIPQNYQLNSTFVTTTAGIPEFTTGKWYAAAGLAKPGTDNLVSFKVYPFFVEGVNNQLDSTGSDLSPPPNITPSPPKPTIPISEEMTSPPAGMIGLWNLLVFGIGGDGFTMTMVDDFVMIFSDGTLTDDIATVLNESIEVSKARNPDDWGEWRQNGDQYEYKWSNDNSFREPAFGHFQVEPGSINQRLNDCFNHMQSAGNTQFGGHDLAVSASTLCFKTDGTFDFSSITTAQGLNYVGWATSPSESGRYRIDGNILQLSYNDGTTKKMGFGFLDDEHEHILFNTSRFQ